MIITKYPDNTSYADIINIPVYNFTFRINSYEDLWHLNQITDAIRHSTGIIPEITIPCLLDAQADRRFAETQSSGLKLVCKLLNSMPATFKIFHPHNREVVEAMLDEVTIIDNTEFIKKAIETHYPDLEEAEQDLILMSTDAGGFKPLMKLADNLNWKGEVFSASKSRHWNGTSSDLIQQVSHTDFKGKNVLIVDDICIHGKTFIGLAEILKKQYIKRLFLAVSHMSLDSVNNNLIKSFDTIHTTNSKYNYYLQEDSKGEQKIATNIFTHKLFNDIIK
jgi:phosphoribosylpyrophosphate synthetase